ncbi:hypothetical protein HIMB5_00011010 [alpha proteobacterium HIMB5]|nr:hypothetical protein HIMB5_00011010 [alpha proteobacterium HIMB5]
MIELSQIFISIALITTFCYFPETYFSKIFKISKKNITFINQLSLGTVFHIFTLLILSFLSLLIDNVIDYFFLIFFLHNFIFFIIEKFRKLKINTEIIFLFFSVFLIIVFFQNNFVIGWDAQNFWAIKTFTILEDDSIRNLDQTPRAEYPFLGSFIWAFYSKYSIVNNEIVGRFFYIFIFCLSLFSISKLFSKNISKNLILYTFLIFLCFDENLFNGYQEVLIFSLFCLIGIEFYYLEKSFNNFKSLIVIFLSCICISWIKNEGLIFSILVLLSLVFYFYRNTKILFFLLIACSFLVSLRYGYLYSNSVNANFQSGNYENFNFHQLLNYFELDRIFMILKYLIIGIFQNIIFLVSLLSMFFLIKKKKI